MQEWTWLSEQVIRIGLKQRPPAVGTANGASSTMN